MSRLRLEGEVETPVEFGFAELAELPGQIEDLTRVVPGREGGAVRLASLLARVGLRTEATHAMLVSSDGGFNASVPLSALGEAVVAYRDGEAPLPENRGGPFRFFIPESAACASAEIDQCANVKFLASIRFTVGAQDDSRPKNPTEHAKLHDHESH